MKKYLIVAWDKYESQPKLDNIEYMTDDYIEANEICSYLIKYRYFDRCIVIDRDQYTVKGHPFWWKKWYQYKKEKDNSDE